MSQKEWKTVSGMRFRFAEGDDKFRSLELERKIICVDFDGVLHSYESGWQGAVCCPDPPVPGALEWLQSLCEDLGFKVCIYSARSGEPGGIDAMAEWLALHAHSMEMLSAFRMLHFPASKPAAHLSIDDRAFCFTGRFPGPDEIAGFRPWWKK